MPRGAVADVAEGGRDDGTADSCCCRDGVVLGVTGEYSRVGDAGDGENKNRICWSNEMMWSCP